LVLGQVSLLPETFPTKLARKGFLSRVCSDVDIDTVLVFEAFVANVTVMQKARLFLGLLLGPPVILPGQLGQAGDLVGIQAARVHGPRLCMEVGGGRLVQDEVTRPVHLDRDDTGGRSRGCGGRLGASL